MPAAGLQQELRGQDHHPLRPGQRAGLDDQDGSVAGEEFFVDLRTEKGGDMCRQGAVVLRVAGGYFSKLRGDRPVTCDEVC